MLPATLTAAAKVLRLRTRVPGTRFIGVSTLGAKPVNSTESGSGVTTRGVRTVTANVVKDKDAVDGTASMAPPVVASTSGANVVTVRLNLLGVTTRGV